MVRGIALLTALLGFALVATAAQEKKDEEKLLGKWKLTKSGEELPPGLEATIDFQKGGKLKVSFKFMGKDESVDGTWKLDGKKLTVTMKKGDKDDTETMEITTLDDKKLVTKDPKGKVDEFEKVKEEKK